MFHIHLIYFKNMDHISKETENKNPCSWSRSSQQLLDYHNNEWGHPVKDEYKLFEKISLES